MDLLYPVRPGDSNEAIIIDMTCIVTNCGKPRHVAAGYCNMHYWRMKTHGEVEPVLARQPRQGLVCVIEGCDTPRYSGKFGWCKRHYDRWRRHGNPLTVLIKMGEGDDITISAVHKRLDAAHGPARTHRCVDCGKPARHWSYDHGDSAEKRCPDHGPYSTDMEYYRPRCVPCHKRFDLDHLQ